MCIFSMCAYMYMYLNLVLVYNNSIVKNVLRYVTLVSKIRSCTKLAARNDSFGDLNGLEGRKMFYLTTHSTQFIKHMVKNHSDSNKGNPLLPHRLLFPD